MTQWKVPQFQTRLGEREAEAAAAAVRSGWITEGPRCEEFVERVKAIAGVKYGVLAPNGTLALYMALKTCDVGEGWEVVVPDLTFVASATAAVMAGARPVFADVGTDGQLDWADCGRVLEERIVHTAVLPVHLYGAACTIPYATLPPTMTIVEDACQALGVTMNGRPCGSFGDAAAFSFFADKTITTGEGGFVGTNDETVYERLRYLRNQGRLDRGSFVHPRIGQNFRMTDVQAAIGLVQLDRMEEIVEKKRAIFRQYVERLAACDFLVPPKGSSFIPFRAVVFFDDARAAEKHLRERGIEPRSAFYPLHRQPCFSRWAKDLRHADENFVNANYFWDHALCLPTWAGMTPAEVELVCDAIMDYRRTRPAQ